MCLLSKPNRTSHCHNFTYLHICFHICQTTYSVKQWPFLKIIKAEFVFNTLTHSILALTLWNAFLCTTIYPPPHTHTPRPLTTTTTFIDSLCISNRLRKAARELLSAQGCDATVSQSNSALRWASSDVYAAPSHFTNSVGKINYTPFQSTTSISTQT